MDSIYKDIILENETTKRIFRNYFGLRDVPCNPVYSIESISGNFKQSKFENSNKNENLTNCIIKKLLKD
jgi:hypothetical protein